MHGRQNTICYFCILNKSRQLYAAALQARGWSGFRIRGSVGYGQRSRLSGGYVYLFSYSWCYKVTRLNKKAAQSWSRVYFIFRVFYFILFYIGPPLPDPASCRTDDSATCGLPGSYVTAQWKAENSSYAKLILIHVRQILIKPTFQLLAVAHLFFECQCYALM